MKKADEKWRKETQREGGSSSLSSMSPSSLPPPSPSFPRPSSPSSSPHTPPPSPPPFIVEQEGEEVKGEEEEREGEEERDGGVLELSMEKRKKEFKPPKFFTEIGEEIDKVCVSILVLVQFNLVFILF